MEVVNTDDPMMQQMEQEYPGLGVADFVLARWQELQIFNPSGGYTAEVTAIVMRGKTKKKKRKQGSDRR
jgi:hypothetical protein